MAEQENFKGFFSYARHDGETDPGLITALTTELERRINARFVNARLTIWRDTERLKVGERWDKTIDDELRSADVLIVLLTPRWIGSEYCRKEFTLFEELEASRRAVRNSCWAIGCSRQHSTFSKASSRGLHRVDRVRDLGEPPS